MIRKPIVADQFYRADPELLERQIRGCFTHKFGPGSLPETRSDKNIIVAISPHAGYPYSGPCAAHVYKEVAESRLPDLFIMLGLSHNGHPSCLSAIDWETPLGVLETDKEFQKVLEQESSLKVDEKVHQFEHSIEVQLPFLQFVLRNKISKVKIAPIIVSGDFEFDEFTRSISKAVNKTGRDVMIIASSDFTHFGVSYGYMPFHKDIKENIYKLDEGAISFIRNLDSYRFLNYVDDHDATICGKNPISVAVNCAKHMHAKEGKLLKYYTSADIVGDDDYSAAVGYAGIVFEAKKEDKK